jgi:predicted nucleotidyltransferase
MRIDKSQVECLKFLIKSIVPEAKVYLFGSRVDDDKKGGDIDLLILANRRLDFKDKAKIEMGFFSAFGEQKLDLVSFVFSQQDSFKQIALSKGVEL